MFSVWAGGYGMDVGHGAVLNTFFNELERPATKRIPAVAALAEPLLPLPVRAMGRI